jgi:hypothetical protein
MKKLIIAAILTMIATGANARDMRHDSFAGACRYLANFNHTGIKKNSFEDGIEKLGEDDYHVQQYNPKDGKYYDCYAKRDNPDSSDDAYVSLFTSFSKIGSLVTPIPEK